MNAKTKKKILIIDDEEGIQTLLLDVLSGQGYEIISAKNGAEGLISAKRNKPDLILLDIMMPEIDGFTVQQLLKEDPGTRNITVLFITGTSVIDNAVRAISQGAAGYIEKPFDLEVLLHKVETLVHKH